MSREQFEAMVDLMKAIVAHAVDRLEFESSSEGDCILDLQIKEAAEILIDPEDDWQEMI